MKKKVKNTGDVQNITEYMKKYPVNMEDFSSKTKTIQ